MRNPPRPPGKRAGAKEGAGGDQPAPLSDEAVYAIASRMRALGEPTRIRIVELLERHPATVQEVTEHLDATPQATTHQNVSKHLRWLRQDGILASRKEGVRVRYELADWTGGRLIRQAKESVAARVEELHDALS